MNVLAVAIALAVSVLSYGASARLADDDAALLADLQAMDLRVAAITDLTASYEQLKHTVLLREPLRSSGVVRVSGEVMRWDTQRPSISHMYMNERVLKIHYPDQNTLEVYELNERLGQLAASPLPRLNTLREHFHIMRDEQHPQIERPHLALLLTPRDDELLQHLQNVRIAIDPDQAFLLRMEMTDVDDERTAIVLTNHRVNTGIEQESLELVVPPGTRTVKPLEDVRGDGAESSYDRSGGL